MNSEHPSDFQPRTALQKLRQDAAALKSFRRIVADYGLVVFLTICYGFIAYLNHSVDSILFFGTLAIIFALHGVSEQRADRRQRYLLEVLSELEQRAELHEKKPTVA